MQNHLNISVFLFVATPSFKCPGESMGRRNEVTVKNVNANIPVSLSWLLLPFLAFLCFAATAQFTDSSLYWLYSVSLQKRVCRLLRF